MSKTVTFIAATTYNSVNYSAGASYLVADAVAAAVIAQGDAFANPTALISTGYTASASKTRPNDTTAYAALDVVCESASAGTVWTFTDIAPSGGGKIIIDQMTLEIDVTAVPSGMGAFRLHLYSTSPTAINDNAAYDLPSGDRTKYLGFIETPVPEDLGSTLWSETEGRGYPVRKQVVAASNILYGILQTVAAYTPTASAVKKVTLHSVAV